MPRITDVRTVLLTGPCTNDPYLSESRRLRSAAFVEVHTDGGIVGLGETYAGYFCPECVPAIVEFFKPILVGQSFDVGADPRAWVSTLWDRMYLCGNFWCRVGLGAIVLTAIDAALWDLVGKALGKPVYELLGGAKHRSLACYATGGPSNYPKDRLAAKADHYLSLGFKGLKVGAGYLLNGEFFQPGGSPQEAADFEGDKAAFLRKHCGNDVQIMFDGHMGNSPFGAWDLPTATAVLKAVEPYGLFFFEEPLPYSDAQAYSELAAAVNVPVAGGECLSAMPEWLEYLRRDSFDIAQPDASYVGGLGEFVRIAGEFEKHGRKIATHAWGAGGSLMQNVHAGFACANTVILEVAPQYADLHSEVIGDSLVIRDGRVLPPQTPGLGITLSADLKARFPFVPDSGEYNSVPGKVLKT